MKKTDFDDYAADYNKILEEQLNFFEGDNHYFAEYKVKQAKRFFQHDSGFWVWYRPKHAIFSKTFSRFSALRLRYF